MADTMRDVYAAVLRQKGGPFVFETIQLAPPRRDEVIVRMVATGMCHADILVRDQVLGPRLPIVLGHEGAGIVVERGADVAELEIGDHVVLSFAFCGACNHCLCGEQAYCDHAPAMNWAAADRQGYKALRDSCGEPLGDFFSASRRLPLTRSSISAARFAFPATLRWSCWDRLDAESRPGPEPS